MDRSMKLLHAVPNFVNQKEYGAGNWKAVEANCLALDRCGTTYVKVAFYPETRIERVTRGL
jgi:hypothetical protein